MKLQRYLMKQCAKGMLLALLLVTTIVVMMLIMKELSNLGLGDYDFLLMLSYIGLMIPSELYQLFPIIILLGALLGLGLLATHYEIIAMKAQGCSTWEFCRHLMSISLLFSLLGMGFGEVIAVPASQKAILLKTSAMSQGQVVHSNQHGWWMRLGGSFVSIGEILPKQLVNVYIFDKQQHHLSRIRFAPFAFYHADGWELKNLTIWKWKKQQCHISHQDAARWPVTFSSALLTGITQTPKYLSIKKLYNTYQLSKRNHVIIYRIDSVLWQRLLMPLSCITMMLLALAQVVSLPRLKSMGSRIFLSILLGFLLLFSQRLFQGVTSTFQWPAILETLIPTGVFLMIGAWQLYQTERR